MSGFTELHKLGYLISNLYQEVGCWRVAFRSPFEFEYFYAKGSSLAECMDNAAMLAHERGPAITACKGYRIARAKAFKKQRRKRKRVRL